MNDAVHAWVAEVLASHPEIEGSVLEVGSRNINGSVRDVFSQNGRFSSYTGIDKDPGEGVDAVADSHALRSFIRSRHFRPDVIVSTEMLEHDPVPWLSLRQFYNALSSRGWLILTTRGFGYPVHDPSDYWRFSPSGLKLALETAGFKVESSAGPEVDREGILGTHALARKR